MSDFPECVAGLERKAAMALLERIYSDYRVVLDGDALDFIERLWASRHIHWPVDWVDRLNNIGFACGALFETPKEKVSP